MKKKYEHKNIFLIITPFFLLIISITLFLIYFYRENLNKSKLLYSYNMNRNLDYNVNLNDNSFIEKNSLEKGKTYISDLIKNIDTNFSYEFLSSKKLNLRYSYNIITTIKGEYQNSSNNNASEVWQKEYILMDKKDNVIENTSRFSINEKPVIDFVELNKEVSNFKSSLKISINAYAIVNMNIKIYDNDTDLLLDDSNITMNIPLNRPAFVIDEKYTNTNSNTITEENKDQSINTYYLYASILIFILDSIIFILNISKLYTKENTKSKYKSNLNKILKSYGSVIVEIVNPIKTKLSGIIDVKDFNEMIDLEEELRTPILFYEIPGRNEGWFTIIHQEILYRYVLKDNSSSNNFNAGTKRRKI